MTRALGYRSNIVSDQGVEECIDPFEVFGPRRFAKVSDSRHLRSTLRADGGGVRDNTGKPAGPVERIEVVWHVRRDFSKNGEIASDHRHAQHQRFDQW